MKKTLIIGASENPERYANIVTKRLLAHHHEVVLLGVRAGEIAGLPILATKPALEGIDTVTLYVGSKNQVEWFDYVLSVKPKRVIFNPGTENPAFYKILEKYQIQVEIACTLVLLSIGEY